MHGLTATQVSRYSRQLLVQQVGVHGQERFLASRVLVVGAGALGCAVLPYLVCAGVGHVTLVDFDLVEEANLPRQILYRESDVGLSKAECAAVRLKELNSKVNVVARNIEFSVDEAEELVAAHDVVVDAR
jgi:molybdopterin/thiamine biosynthesis adenylyltransferase